MNIYSLIIETFLTMIAYIGFPTYKFAIKKEVNDINVRKKIIFWNSVIVAILFIVIRSIKYGLEFGVQSFGPSLFYYSVNLVIYARNNKHTSTSKEKNNTFKIKNVREISRERKKSMSFQTYRLTYLCIICVTIFTTTLSSIFLFNYMQILKEKERNKISNKLQSKIHEYNNCHKYLKKIYINIGTFDTKTGIISDEITIDNDSYNNFQKLKLCLEKAYKK